MSWVTSRPEWGTSFLALAKLKTVDSCGLCRTSPIHNIPRPLLATFELRSAAVHQRHFKIALQPLTESKSVKFHSFIPVLRNAFRPCDQSWHKEVRAIRRRLVAQRSDLRQLRAPGGCQHGRAASTLSWDPALSLNAVRRRSRGNASGVRRGNAHAGIGAERFQNQVSAAQGVAGTKSRDEL
jgi:hypothetical protein